MRSHLRLALFVFLLASAPARSDPAFAIEIAGAKIAVTFASDGPPQALVREWISDSAKAVAAYYGKFPVSELRILVVPVEGSGVRSGKSYGYNGAAIRVSLGKSTIRDQLRDDWVMPHEMVHLAFPSVPDAHVWIEEGLATYVEPWARLMIGNLSEKEVWSELVYGLPKGLPRAGDAGLDRTHTWGRTYWGGALFCLLADIEIRKRTANKYGLRDGLRAIVAAGGTIEKQWPLAKAFAVADTAVGVPVLTELYERMKETSVSPDLGALWSELGIIAKDGVIRFDDSAPLAHVRQAMADDYSRREVGTIR
ncbi:MAG: hypothetical protein ACREV9_08100 [Burkholderiales bacterium]